MRAGRPSNAGSSALISGQSVKKQVIALAALTLGVPEGDIDVEDGFAIARTGNKPTLSFAEGSPSFAQVGVPGVSFAAGQIASGSSTRRTSRRRRRSYCNGTHVAEVEVDPATGGVTLTRYTVGHDSGNIVNPMIVDGQVQGGVAHGVGNALFEHMVYDAGAQPQSITFADYLMPTAPEVPNCTIEHIETPNPLNPLGVKGAGEGGTIPAAAAIVSAIEDALSPFGVRFREAPPLTPARIVEELRRAGAYDQTSPRHPEALGRRPSLEG